MNGGGPDNGDDNMEEITNPQFLPADHPLYNRLQKALEKQGGDEYERVHLEYLDKSNTLKALEKEKEEVGVQLYGLQQQLADMQQSFQDAHDNYNKVSKTREENEAKLTSLSENLEFRKTEISDLRKKVDRATDELYKLNINLNFMKEHNQELKSELKLTQRTTHRTEENIVSLEKEKKIQDLLIDQMNEEIKRLTEQISVLDAQRIAQEDQTKEAKSILQEANIEMDKILTSKKNLLEHWKKATFEIMDKDKNLQKIKDTLKLDQETNIKITSEIAGVEKEIRDQNELQATKGDVYKRMENIKAHYISKNQKLEERMTKIEARNAILKQSLDQTQAEMKRRETEIKNLKDQITQIEDNIMKLHMATRDKEEEIIDKVSNHKTVSKTTINLRKQIAKMESDLEEKQMELAKQENEMARINIDILNTENQINQLEIRKKEVNDERAQNERKVDTCEKRIKENHEVHEKKMHDVAKYNKEHDKAMQKQTVFSKGPSDGTLLRLRKEIDEIDQKSKKLQGEFIKNQTLYVKREFYANNLQEENTELRRKETILEQKRIRLNAQYAQHAKEIKRINTNLKNFENDMNKLNEFLAVSYEKAKNLQNDNINIDSEIVQKLKALEKESVGLELQIDRLKENKAELLQEIVEAERQILLWERKIQLQKEMQEKLDPNFGMSDIEKLKKQIHLMELNLNDIRKKQEQIIIEMERIVYKKESIQLKYTNTDKIKKDGKNPTQISKDIQALKTSIAESSKGLKEMDNNLRTKENELKKKKLMIDNTNEKINTYDYELDKALEHISEKKIEKLVLVNTTAALQKQTRALEDMAQTGVKKATEAQRTQLNQLTEQNVKLQEALVKFVEDNPKFSTILAPVTSLKLTAN
jgi:hypothetical protein